MSDLYVESHAVKLSLSGEKLLVSDLSSVILREIALGQLDNILIFGQAQLTTQLLKKLATHGVNVYYFSESGNFLLAMDSYRQSDFEKQYLQAKAVFNKQFSLEIARRIVVNKMHHQVALLHAYDEDGLIDELDDKKLLAIQSTADKAESLSELMGCEGRLAKSYFYFLSLMVPQDFSFDGRHRRPAHDYFNSLLNFGYSVLYSFFVGMIKKSGLSQGFAYLHQPHDHHATLASDLMEVWRPLMVDDTVMQLIRQGLLTAEDFINDTEKGMLLTSKGRQIFLTHLKQRMLEIHPYRFGDEKRYDFLYAVEQQINSLFRAIEIEDASLYRGVRTEENDE